MKIRREGRSAFRTDPSHPEECRYEVQMGCQCLTFRASTFRVTRMPYPKRYVVLFTIGRRTLPIHLLSARQFAVVTFHHDVSVVCQSNLNKLS